jgi:enoyl-CoA hydratase
VSLAVDDSDVLEVALEIASGLARGPQHALCWTKRVLNHWLRDAAPIFEASLAYEAVRFFGGEHVEALQAIRDQRPPAFAESVPW